VLQDRARPTVQLPQRPALLLRPPQHRQLPGSPHQTCVSASSNHPFCSSLSRPSPPACLPDSSRQFATCLSKSPITSQPVFSSTCSLTEGRLEGGQQHGAHSMCFNVLSPLQDSGGLSYSTGAGCWDAVCVDGEVSVAFHFSDGELLMHRCPVGAVLELAYLMPRRFVAGKLACPTSSLACSAAPNTCGACTSGFCLSGRCHCALTHTGADCSTHVLQVEDFDSAEPVPADWRVRYGITALVLPAKAAGLSGVPAQATVRSSGSGSSSTASGGNSGGGGDVEFAAKRQQAAVKSAQIDASSSGSRSAVKPTAGGDDGLTSLLQQQWQQQMQQQPAQQQALQQPSEQQQWMKEFGIVEEAQQPPATPSPPPSTHAIKRATALPFGTSGIIKRSTGSSSGGSSSGSSGSSGGSSGGGKQPRGWLG